MINASARCSRVSAGSFRGFAGAGLRVGAALGAALLCGAAMGQDLTVKTPPQHGTVCIYDAVIHPISGPDIARGYVVFTDGKIVEVGAGQPRVPAGGAPGYAAIDAKGEHVYPGLVGAYSQMGMTEIQSVAATIDTSETGSITPEVRAATAVNPDSTLIPVTRSNGVLVCGVFPQGGTIEGQPSVIRLEGWTSADMTMAGSIGLAVRWPSSRGFGRFGGGGDDAAGREAKVIADAFDAAEAYAKQRAADPKATVDLRWEAMREVFAPTFVGELTSVVKESDVGIDPALPTTGGKPLFISANDVDQITSAVAFCAGRGLKCVIVGGRDAALCADLLKEKGVPVIVLGTHRMPRRDDAAYDEAYTLPARLFAAGVKFAIANGDETAHERNVPYEAATAVAYGLPMEAGLKSVTLWPAEILGVADQVGSLESGKSATLIVTTGNPLEETSNVVRAFVDGREIDLSNKQTKLAEKYRERYRQMGLLKGGEGAEAGGGK